MSTFKFLTQQSLVKLGRRLVRRQDVIKQAISTTSFFSSSSSSMHSSVNFQRGFGCCAYFNQFSNGPKLKHAVSSYLITQQRWYCKEDARNKKHSSTGIDAKTDSTEEKSTTTTPPPSNKVDNIEEDLFGESSKLGLIAKFKLMYKKYWYVLIPVHLVTSAAWFGGFYYLSKSGVDIGALLQYINVSEAIVEKMHKSSMGHLAVAYLCYKIATPFRYGVTIGGTTVAIKHLVKSGYIKPVPTKNQLMAMYEQKKTDLTNAKDEWIQKRDERKQKPSE